MNPANLAGIALAVLGAIGFSAAAQIQHSCVHQAASQYTQRPGHWEKIWSWLRQPRWMAGFALNCLSVVIHLIAVIIAPVSLVQPVGALAVPFSLLYTSFRTGIRPPRRVQLGVAAILVGTAGFTLGAAIYSTHDLTWVISGQAALMSQLLVGVVSVTLMLLGHLHQSRTGGLAWGISAGLLYGLSTANMKHLVYLLEAAQIDWFGVTLVAGVIVVSYAAGIWCVQQGYALSNPELVVGCLTVFDPLVAVGFGFIVLGEAAKIPWGVSVAMLGSGAVAVLGVILTSLTDRMNQSASD